MQMGTTRTRPMAFIIALSVALAGSLAGCGSGDLTLSQADPNIVAESPAWEVVYPIFQRECIPCHTGTEQDDGDGEEDRSLGDHSASSLRVAGGVEPGLESCDAIQQNLDDIFLDIFVNNDMPPGAWPRLNSEEKLIIQRWLDNGAVGPCN